VQAAVAKLFKSTLVLPSVLANICADRLPEPEDNGIRFLKIPR